MRAGTLLGWVGVRLAFSSRTVPQFDQLQLYHQAFGRTTHDHGGERIEVALQLCPGDEIAVVNVRIPTAAVELISPGVPLVLVSAPRGRGDRPVELTELVSETGAGHLVSGRTARYNAIHAPADMHEGNAPWVFSFHAWELVTPPQGVAPYLYATADMRLRFPALAGIPLLLTIITPEDISPRSTQGNFAMAYPSRLLKGQRYTNIYFPSAEEVRLAYRCGASGQLAGSPWVSVGRAAFNALFVFCVGFLAASVDRNDRFTALLAIFIAAASALWEIIQDTARFTIYGRGRGYIHAFVLAAQLVSLIVLSSSVVSIGLADSDRLLRYSSYLALAASAGLILMACTGFFLHYQGFWQGFQCDHLGCRTVFRIRRNRPECRYTGRVFCDRHALSVCGNCVHGPDLKPGTITTIDDYRTDRLRCRGWAPVPPGRSAGS